MLLIEVDKMSTQKCKDDLAGDNIASVLDLSFHFLFFDTRLLQVIFDDRKLLQRPDILINGGIGPIGIISINYFWPNLETQFSAVQLMFNGRW
jgi:hypothetical protein